MHFRIALRLALASVLLLPAFAFAQWSAWDGGDWEGADRSPYRDKIENLDDDIDDDIPIPVLGIKRSQITNNFGDPRGGGTRKHEGLDIVAPEGTPIASPTEAVVVRIGDGPDSGLYVRTANPGGDSFVYMHLSKVAKTLDEGDKLDRGEILGFVGNTGNASGGGAHLHFEIRNDGATDPYPRVTEVFSQQEFDEALEQALARGGDKDVIARLQGKEVEDEPEPEASVKPANTAVVFGATNGSVKALQQFLIDTEAGSAARELAQTGATGYFGQLTLAALKEFQRSEELEVTGVVDDDTYALAFAPKANDDEEDEEPAEEQPEVAGEEVETPDTVGSLAFARDLEVGIEGDDVKALQVFLNTHGYKLAESGPGSPGNETTMFGGLTRTALAKYQAANSIAPSIGYFGPITRAHVLKLALN